MKLGFYCIGFAHFQCYDKVISIMPYQGRKKGCITMARAKRQFDGNYTNKKNEWNADHYVRATIMIKKNPNGFGSSERDRLKALAKAQGKSTSRYIIDAINAYAGENVLSTLDNESKKKKVTKDRREAE